MYGEIVLLIYELNLRRKLREKNVIFLDKLFLTEFNFLILLCIDVETLIR